MPSDRRHAALAAVAPHFPNAIAPLVSDNDVAEEILSYTNWKAEACSEWIGTVQKPQLASLVPPEPASVDTVMLA